MTLPVDRYNRNRRFQNHQGVKLVLDVAVRPGHRRRLLRTPGQQQAEWKYGSKEEHRIVGNTSMQVAGAAVVQFAPV